jgi:N-acyl homoserine lactone hydrolase
MENFYPPKEIKAMEMDVIPPGTHINTYESYDIMLKIKEPKFASIEEIP